MDDAGLQPLTIHFLDDRPVSIHYFVEAAQHYGFRAEVHSSLISFANACESDGDAPIAAIVLDLYMPGVEDLAVIGVPGVAGGQFAGFAVAEHYLSGLGGQIANMPLLFLSDVEYSSLLLERIAALRESGRRVEALAKYADRHAFEVFLRSVIADAHDAHPVSFGAIVTLDAPARDGMLISLIEPAYDALLKALLRDPNLMDQLDPRKWEEVIAASYKRAGFDDVVLTPRSGDLGRDVVAIRHGFGAIKFIEQVKAYRPGHVVTADEVRALVGVLAAEQDASKAVFTTTSTFAPRLRDDRLLKPLMPFRLHLVDRSDLIARLQWKVPGGDG